MAVDDLTDSDLTCLDMSAFFPLHTTCIALRRDSRLRSFTQFFITAFAPHLTVQTLKRAQAAQSRKEVKQLFAGLKWIFASFQADIRAGSQGGGC